MWSSPCPFCHGSEEECDKCGGSGSVLYNRCPNSMVAEAPKATQLKLDLLMRAYHHYDTRNVLPSEGAWLDQSRSFLMCVEIIDAERGYWDKVLHEHQQREAERASKASSASSTYRR